METETKRNILFVGICVGIIVLILLYRTFGFEKTIKGILFGGVILLIYFGIYQLSKIIFPEKK